MMTWPDIVGHQQIFQRFEQGLKRGRLASTFLFVGPSGIGKRTVALGLAKALLCEQTPPDQLEACGECPGCRQVEAATHPDLILIQKPADRSFIPINLLIGDRDHRMREGLCHDISLKPFRGHRKVAIIDDADYLNQEGANCLLKTLEEPPAGALLILIGTSEHRQLPTIRSRCQIVRFAPLTEQQIAELLVKGNLVDDPQKASLLAARAAGSIEAATDLLADDFEPVWQSLYRHLAEPDFDEVSLIKELTNFVDAAGKDATPRRRRLRLVIGAASSFYYHLMHELLDDPSKTNSTTKSHVQQALGTWQGGAPAAADCLQRCLQCLGFVDANANLSTLIPGWIDDLAQSTLRNRQG